MPEFNDLNGVYNHINAYLNDTNNAKISIIFASNTSGKTRLSRQFCDAEESSVLCYNAFFEDCFSWDNESFILKILENSWINKLIKAEGIDKEIDDNFKRFTSGRIESNINDAVTEVTFKLLGDDENKENIKISKGEESLFIWSVFYTILGIAIDNLIESIDNRTTNYFDNLKNIVIDDPVSSMDDKRIISVGLAITELLDKIVKNQDKLNPKLGILITTHHALFFSVIHNKSNKSEKRKQQDYVLSREGKTYVLEEQNTSSPFAYHHEMLLEIKKAIRTNSIKRYHFNLFRCLLEKTANFLGYGNRWSELVKSKDSKELFAKMLNQYSHNQLSETEARFIEGDDKELFINTFETFLKDYKWKYS